MVDKKIIKHLSQDPILAKIIVDFPLPELTPPGDLFAEITENILGQQLSGKAANTIIARFIELFNLPAGKAGSKYKSKFKKFPTPKQILDMPDEKIRGAGTSWAKVAYIKNLAQSVENGQLDLVKIVELQDEIVVERLTKIKGIGKWTAEMVLIFYLQREDVFSIGDQGLKNAVFKNYKIDQKDLKKILKLSEKWKPYRSYASRWLWQSLNNREITD